VPIKYKSEVNIVWFLRFPILETELQKNLPSLNMTL